MRRSERTSLLVIGLFLLAPLLVVHPLLTFAPAQSQPVGRKDKTKVEPLKIHYGQEDLPGPVRELREAMLSAVQSGQIEELRHLYEAGDLKPDLGPAVSGDPVAHWRKVSGDGEGREVLAALSLILEAGYVVLPLGRDLENNRLYVWPYFTEVSIHKLTPAQEVELLRLVSPASLRNMRAKGRYTYWRLAIGADGTWHSFRKDE
jgi:hypothetical protein